jgi:hypothetical protein
VINLVKLESGTLRRGDKVCVASTGQAYDVDEVCDVTIRQLPACAPPLLDSSHSRFSPFVHGFFASSFFLAPSHVRPPIDDAFYRKFYWQMLHLGIFFGTPCYSTLHDVIVLYINATLQHCTLHLELGVLLKQV